MKTILLGLCVVLVGCNTTSPVSSAPPRPKTHAEFCAEGIELLTYDTDQFLKLAVLEKLRNNGCLN